MSLAVPKIVKSFCVGLLALATATITAVAADPVSITSPDGRLIANFHLDTAGMPSYNVTWQGKAVISNSQLRQEITEWPWIGAFEVTGVTNNQKDETWRPVCGERRELHNHYNEVAVELRTAQPPYRRLCLTFRAYDTGIAFQYTIPAQAVLDKINITRESSEFRFTGNYAAWATYSAQGSYKQVTLNNIRPGCERPLTIQTAENLFVALGEAKLTDYARMKFAPLTGKAPGVVSHLDGKVMATLPLTTPWRVVMVAESAGKLLENNSIFPNLNDPCAIADTSWIKPGNVLRNMTLTTVGAKACVDFAAKHNLQYILFDAGWYGPEFSPKSDARVVNLDPNRSPGPLGLQEIIRYASARGIGVILYVNYVAAARQLDDILPLYHSWGVKGVKYGFVKVGPQDVTAFMTRAIRQAAENRLMVDIHDEYRPTGFSRTYPNLMTTEGILGDEAAKRTNDQSLTVLFSRFLAGPADNTICYYDSRVDRLCSHAYQLAKAVCFFSPWQHLYWYDRPADAPIRHVGRPGREKPVIGDEPELVFFDHLPTVWDDTRVLHGKIGEYAVIARRSGDKWFVGCMNNTTPRTLEVPLSFLEPGRTYQADIYSDDPVVPTRTHVKIEHRKVDASTVLRVVLSANGGQAIELSTVAANP